jgi:hypothetical protein
MKTHRPSPKAHGPLVLSPCQLLALHAGHVDPAGNCGGDRVIRKALIARGLAKWSHADEKFCLITDAGRDVIRGCSPFVLRGKSEDTSQLERAQQLTAAIREAPLVNFLSQFPAKPEVPA